MRLGLDGLEMTGGVADERRRIVDKSMVLWREPADTAHHTEEPTRPSQ